MTRDFSESAKQKLLEYIEDVTETTVWGKVGDVIGDVGLHVQHWFGELNISNYIDNVDTYHKKILDKNNTTASKIEEIFRNVKNIDIRYENGLSQENSYADGICELISSLSDTINPDGGNMNIQAMKATLSASLEKIRENQLSKNKVIEENMLGTDPDATEMSADPVNLSTGNFVYEHEDLQIGGEIPLSFHRYYNSKDVRIGALGKCFRHNYEISIEEKDEDILKLHFADGQTVLFDKISENIYRSSNGIAAILVKEANGYKLENLTKEKFVFNKDGKILRQENSNGRGINFLYNDRKQLVEARTDTGLTLRYCYDDNTSYLVKVVDDTGRCVTITYRQDAIEKVMTPGDQLYSYTYGENRRIVEVVNARNVTAVKNTYDKKFRIIHQDFPDSGRMSFEYDDENQKVLLTERNGSKLIYVHDEKYRNVETIYEDGTKEKYIYNERNQCVSEIDRNGNVKRRAYDNRGNLTQYIDAVKRRVNFTYNADNRLTNLSVNGNEKMKLCYDSRGNLTSIENACGENSSVKYDQYGRVIGFFYANGSKEELVYDDRGNIVQLIEKDGGISEYEYDCLNRVITSKDANGNKTSYEYDMCDRVTKIIDPLGNQRVYKYNTGGKVTSLKDFDGYEILFTYNAIGKVASHTDKEGYTTGYEYDKMWNVSSQKKPDGACVQFSYDGDNRLSSEQYPCGKRLTYEYDAVGNRTKVVDAEGNETHFVYDAGNRLIEEQDAEGHITSYHYDREGNLDSMTDPLGNVTLYTYDALGRKTSETNAVGDTTYIYYDYLGNIERVCYPNGSQKKYVYGIDGRLECVKNPDGSSESYQYDKNGNLIKRSNGLGDATIMKYDALNRMVESVNPLGARMLYKYDAMGNVIEMLDEVGNKSVYEYSPNGNLTKVVDAVGNESMYEYDCIGRLIKTICMGSNGEVPQIKTFTWDDAGQLSSVTDSLGHTESYLYDKNGNMIEKTDKEGYHTSFAYNKTGQVEAVIYGDGRRVELSYNPLKQLERVKDWNGTTEIILDELGRALKITDVKGNAIGYEWGQMNERKAIVYPDGKRAEYEYNQNLQLMELHTPQETVRYEYDEIGRLKQKNLPNGVRTAYEYNAAGYVSAILHEGKEIYESYQYQYDTLGRKIGVKKVRKGIDEDNGFFAYDYDAMHRLISVKKDNKLLRTYEYDAFGNRTKKKEYLEKDFKEITYAYNTNNQLIHEADGSLMKDYEYDKRGNLLSVKDDDGLLKAFTFDATNQMITSMGIVNGIKKYAEYQYDGLGQRISQKISDEKLKTEKRIEYILDKTRSYYNMLQLKSDDRGMKQNFYWDSNVVGVETDKRELYYLQDDLGSPMCVLDDEGMTCDIYAYDEFGIGIGCLKEQNYRIQPFGFTGYQTDEVNGMCFAQARRYDANAGRFTSEDRIKGTIVVPYSLNTYNYCWNNPLMFVDLDGRFAISAILAAAGAGALVGLIPVVIEDIKSGEDVGIKDYVSAGISGAVMGAVSLFGHPTLAIMASSVVSNLIVGIWDFADGTKDLNFENLTDWLLEILKDLVIDAGIGWLLGKFSKYVVEPLLKYLGVIGRGSFKMVYEMVKTKLKNGTWVLTSLSIKTLMKIFAYLGITELMDQFTDKLEDGLEELTKLIFNKLDDAIKE